MTCLPFLSYLVIVMRKYERRIHAGTTTALASALPTPARQSPLLGIVWPYAPPSASIASLCVAPSLGPTRGLDRLLCGSVRRLRLTPRAPALRVASTRHYVGGLLRASQRASVVPLVPLRIAFARRQASVLLRAHRLAVAGLLHSRRRSASTGVFLSKIIASSAYFMYISREQRGAQRAQPLVLRQRWPEPIRHKVEAAALSPLFLPFLHGVAATTAPIGVFSVPR
jgi:hypothetical protein